MKSNGISIAIAALFVAGAAGAQPATYDGASGVLTIPSVSVGTTTYGSVKLLNTGNFNFTLQAAFPQPALTTAEGIWRGTAAGSLVTWINLDNGAFYIFQTVPDHPNEIEGFIYGSSTSGNGSFSAGSAKSFNFVEGEVLTTGAITATYQARKWISGSSKDDTGQNVVFGAYFDSTYDAVPSLSELAGTYSGLARFGPPFNAQALSATLNASGGVGGSIGGCAFAGTITPRPRGKLYDIAVSFGSGCDFPGQTFIGIAYLDPLMQRLMVGALNAQRTVAGMFIATK